MQNNAILISPPFYSGLTINSWASKAVLESHSEKLKWKPLSRRWDCVSVVVRMLDYEWGRPSSHPWRSLVDPRDTNITTIIIHTHTHCIVFVRSSAAVVSLPFALFQLRNEKAKDGLEIIHCKASQPLGEKKVGREGRWRQNTQTRLPPPCRLTELLARDCDDSFIQLTAQKQLEESKVC